MIYIETYYKNQDNQFLAIIKVLKIWQYNLKVYNKKVSMLSNPNNY